MRIRHLAIEWLLVAITTSLVAQTGGTSLATTNVQIPHLLRFNGSIASGPASRPGNGDTGDGLTLDPTSHQPKQSVVAVFSLYAQQTGDTPLWEESQTVDVDATGHYTVLLGSNTTEGLPVELFSSGEARWLGVQLQGHPGQKRIMLLSVPFALKAADIDAFGGKPPSAYALATNSDGMNAANAISSDASSLHPIAGGGTTNYLPLWTSPSTLSSSFIYQSSAGNVGIQESNPQARLQLGNAAPGIKGTTTQATGYGISGVANQTAALTFGVTGLSYSSGGDGVYGNAASTTGVSIGVMGTTAVNDDENAAAGVFGASGATTGHTISVFGKTSDPTGMGGRFLNTATSGTNPTGIGAYSASDTLGNAVAGFGITGAVTSVVGQVLGVVGTTNQDGGVGVLGTTDDAIAVRGRNNTIHSQVPTADFDNVQNRSQIAPVLIAHSEPFGGFCEMNVSGNIDCNGSISAAVPVDDGSRRVALYAEDAPENWFEDAGSGSLDHGSATVTLEPIFAQTVNSDLEYHVFLTPTGNCKGLYVGHKTANGFEVHELGSGTSSVGFDYRIVVRRKGFENVRLADKTEEFSAHIATRKKHTVSGSSAR